VEAGLLEDFHLVFGARDENTLDEVGASWVELRTVFVEPDPGADLSQREA
jgi:hypothetical protein